MGRATKRPDWLIRFIIFGPAVFDIFQGIPYISRTLRQPALKQPPYSPNIRHGTLLTAISITLTMVWNFMMLFFVWGEGLSASSVLMLGLCDLAIASILTTAVMMQSTYIPHMVGDCNVVAETYQVPRNVSSLFRLTSAVNSNTTVVVGTCEEFQTIWYVGLSIMILALTLAGLNIWASGWWKKDSDITVGSIIKIISEIKVTILAILWATTVPLPRWVVEHFTDFCKPLLRFIRRYFRKWRIRHHHQQLIKKKLERQLLDPRYQNSQSRDIVADVGEKKTTQVTCQPLSSKISLATLPYDVTVLICQHLHGVDIFHLGLTSKLIRHTLLGHENTINRISSQFKKYSCSGKKKAPCWSCGIQICDRCSTSKTCEGTPTAKHLRRCKPTCTYCYFTLLRKSFDLPSSLTNCNVSICRLSAHAGNLAPEHAEPRRVCRNCSELDAAQLTDMREERDKVSVEELGMEREGCCRRCKAVIGDVGARWWSCGLCGGECRSGLHVSWIGKRKEEKGDAV